MPVRARQPLRSAHCALGAVPGISSRSLKTSTQLLEPLPCLGPASLRRALTSSMRPPLGSHSRQAPAPKMGDRLSLRSSVAAAVLILVFLVTGTAFTSTTAIIMPPFGRCCASALRGLSSRRRSTVLAKGPPGRPRRDTAALGLASLCSTPAHTACAETRYCCPWPSEPVPRAHFRAKSEGSSHFFP